LGHLFGIKCRCLESSSPITLIMREEYSESNNSKMSELALLPHANLNMTAARKIDRDDEPLILKYNGGVIGCNFESISRGLKPSCHRLNQVFDSNNMKYSGPSVRRKGVDGEGKFRLKNGIDNNTAGITFQW
jgi:hypothetical protein